MICVALPGLAISSEEGQLIGRGLEGFYRAGRRVLSRCEVRVAGREPLAVQARMISADRARFVGTLRTSPQTGPDPDVIVERNRFADGTERITLHSAATCRPAATAAAAGVLLLTTLAGIRPDVPAGTVTLRPVRSAPLGEIGLMGLRVAGAPFSVRVGRLGLAMVEEAADGLQLGV
ncbi:glycogen debranching N-terminal domain-containing protein [Streptomyces sp. NPDC046832]|uniref:glycogen debranching N-terminal domain-containing protein n=1 Tax=Streptomyces sp. NPDC046832 TaxID=3155020 RepID=UPI0033D611C5